MGIADWVDRTFYPNSERRGWDDRLLQRTVVGLLDGDHTGYTVVLDLGAGWGNPWLNLRGKASRICGLDPDRRVLENPYLDEARLGTGEAIPYGDETFDVVMANNVLEHLEQPLQVLREVHRVLKPGGFFVAKTTNRRHYFALVSRLTPHGFHRFYYSLRHIDGDDSFPTFYRANSARDLRALAERSGLEVVSVALIEGRPVNLRWFWPAYLMGFAHERLVNACNCLRPFRAMILVQMQRETPGGAK